MKFKIALLLPLLTAFALNGGCVISRTPVGDKVPELKPEIWNAKWLGGDGKIVRTKIKDARLGIVEMTARQPFPKLGVERQEILVRTLGPLQIVNQKMGDDHQFEYEFGRVDIDAAHLLVFGADVSGFAKLIKRHEIVGEFDKGKHGKPTGSCSLNGFSDKDYQRLQAEGFDVRSLFSQDPGTVLVRYRSFWQ
jgi:hypothetical protein